MLTWEWSLLSQNDCIQVIRHPFLWSRIYLGNIPMMICKPSIRLHDLVCSFFWESNLLLLQIRYRRLHGTYDCKMWSIFWQREMDGQYSWCLSSPLISIFSWMGINHRPINKDRPRTMDTQWRHKSKKTFGFTDYGCPNKPFFIEIQKFWAGVDKVGR